MSMICSLIKNYSDTLKQKKCRKGKLCTDSYKQNIDQSLKSKLPVTMKTLMGREFS